MNGPVFLWDGIDFFPGSFSKWLEKILVTSRSTFPVTTQLHPVQVCGDYCL